MLTFFHAPGSRSCATHWLLAEIGIPFETRIIDIRFAAGPAQNRRTPPIQGQLPAIIHDGVTVTGHAAIASFLADTFPASGLAPALGDRRRGPYLSWLAYGESVLVPAMIADCDRKQCDPLDPAFGGLADALAQIERTLAATPYIAGDRFTAADTAIGSALHCRIGEMRTVRDNPVLRAYLGRLTRRPAFARTIGDASFESFAQAA